jgi:hypothetical protein
MALDTENLKHLHVALHVDESADVSEAAPVAKAFLLAHDAETASTDPFFGTNGLPRMLRVSLWMAHEGKFNRNRDGFKPGSLRKAVELGLASASNPLMIDYNHDFTPVGVWTRATYRFNPKNSLYGVLLEGVIFAWRFPELTDTLVAEQARNGYIEGSMACMAAGYENGKDDSDAEGTWILEPTFFTTSVLDVPPADPNSVGLVSENPNETAEERERALTSASADIPDGPPEAIWELDMATIEAQARHKEEQMNEFEKLLAAIREAMGEVTAEQTTQLAALVAAAQAVPGLEEAARVAREQLETVQARVAELEAQVVERDGTVSELTLANESLIAERATATEELGTFRAAADAVAAEAETQRLAALREARMAQLHGSVRAALDAREEADREALVARWLGEDDATWDGTLALLNAGREGSSVDYTARTAAEGEIPAAGATNSDGAFAISRFRNK